MTGNLISERFEPELFRVEGFALQYESYEHEDYYFEVEDISLYYDPLFDREYEFNLFKLSGNDDLFRDIGVNFYEVDSIDFAKFCDVTFEALESLKGRKGRFNRARRCHPFEGAQDLRSCPF